MHFSHIAVLPLLLVSVACGGSSSIAGSSSGGSRVESEDGLDHALLDAAGDRAAVTVIFHPRHWSVLGRAATALLGELLPDNVRTLLSAPGPWDAARIFAEQERMQLPRTLDGWDDSRPLVLALFEPPDLSVSEILNLSTTERPPEIFSHRFIIPASDSQALLIGLLTVAESAGCEALPASVAARFPDSAGALRCHEMALIFETGEGFVRVRAAEGEDDAIRSGPLAEPVGGAIAVTPPLRWSVAGSVVLAAYVRPSRLRSALLAEAATKIARALRHASPEARTRLLAAGQVELLGAALRTSPVGAEVDDVAVGLVTGRRPTLTLVQALTDLGVSTYEAGMEAPVSAEGPVDAPFVVRSRVDIDAMQAAAGVPFGFGGVSDLESTASRVQACGPFCNLHLFASRTFGLGKLADQVGFRAALEEEIGPLFRFEPAELPRGVTMEMTVDLSTFELPRDLREVAAQIGVVHAIQAFEGRTVMTTLRAGEAPPSPEPSALAYADPGARGGSARRDESAACVEQVALAIEALLEALPRADSNRSPLVRRARQDLARLGECPDASGELRELREAYSRVFEAAVE